jgi:hypothetical protein
MSAFASDRLICGHYPLRFEDKDFEHSRRDRQDAATVDQWHAELDCGHRRRVDLTQPHSTESIPLCQSARHEKQPRVERLALAPTHNSSQVPEERIQTGKLRTDPSCWQIGRELSPAKRELWFQRHRSACGIPNAGYSTKKGFGPQGQVYGKLR